MVRGLESRGQINYFYLHAGPVQKIFSKLLILPYSNCTLLLDVSKS